MKRLDRVARDAMRRGAWLFAVCDADRNGRAWFIIKNRRQANA